MLKENTSWRNYTKGNPENNNPVDNILFAQHCEEAMALISYV
jgi:hypothetical protein